MKKFLWLFFAMLLLAGCATEEKLRTDWEKNPTVRIAVLLPFSGKNAEPAQQMLEGIRFSTERLNRHKGIAGHMVELVLCDTHPDARKAVHQAVSRGAVAAIIGFNSKETAELLRLTAAVRLPTVIPVATDDEQEGATPFTFRNAYTNRQQSEVLAGYLWYWQQRKKVGVLVDSSPDNLKYARSVARGFAQYFRDLGGTVVRTLEIPENEKKWDPILRTMLTYGPQAILITSASGPAARMVRRLRSLGYRGILCGPDMWDDYEFLMELGSTDPGECFFTSFISEENNSGEAVQFRKEFRKEFFHNPGSSETQSSDAMRLLAAGLWNAKTLKDFRKNWLGIKNYIGAAGTYTMLKGGGVDRTVFINSFGVDRNGAKLRPFPRLTHKMQYSKLETYRADR